MGWLINRCAIPSDGVLNNVGYPQLRGVECKQISILQQNILKLTFLFQGQHWRVPVEFL